MGDFSVLSTGAPQYSNMSNVSTTKGVKGSDGRFWVLFIPFGGAPSLQDAVDECLDKGQGDYIERARCFETEWSLILLSWGSYSVVGDVGNSKALVKPASVKAVDTDGDKSEAAPAVK